MIKLLKKIYVENDFQVKKITDEIMFSEKIEQEYYLTVPYHENEIEYFFESDKTNEIILKFEELGSEKGDIKKNTSLIVFIETDSIESFYNKHRNSVFKIEEDEYFFRKYVIVYSKSSIEKINDGRNIKDQIHEILTDDRMEEFQNNYYADEEFLVAMQLIVSFPFFIFQREQREFKSLSEKVDNNIANENLNIINDSLQIFHNIFIEGQIDKDFKLEDAFLSEEMDQDILNDFFNLFEVTKS